MMKRVNSVVTAMRVLNTVMMKIIHRRRTSSTALINTETVSVVNMILKASLSSTSTIEMFMDVVTELVSCSMLRACAFKT